MWTSNEPWHYTTFLDFLDHWQTLITGVLALIAAIITLGVTLRIERRKVERELAALSKFVSVRLARHPTGEAKTYDCLVVTAVNEGQRPVEVQRLAIRLAAGGEVFLIDAEPERQGPHRIHLPHRLEPEQSVSAKVDSTDICIALVEREIKGDVTLLGVCVDRLGAEFVSGILGTTVEYLIEHATS